MYKTVLVYYSMNQSKRDFLLGVFFQPLRIVSILIILPLLLPIEFSWETAQWFFYGFVILFPSSFFVESLFRIDRSVLGIDKSIFQNKSRIQLEFTEAFKVVYPKYLQNVSIEFVAIASFVLLSLPADENLVLYLHIKILIITTLWQIFTEIHHAKLIPVLNQIQISEKIKVFSIIPISLFLVGFWIWVYFYVKENFIGI